MYVNQIAGYEVLASLGHGARSNIYAVKDKDGALFALKQVGRTGENDERFLEQAVQEHEIANKFDHPILRKSYKLIKERKLFRVVEIIVIMEMVDGYTLEQERPTNMLTICRIVRHVATGLDAMHEAGYVHCDMKPNNIIYGGSGQVKVIDFGQSCPIGTIKPRIQGTPDYIAPEQVRREKLTPQTDIFNLGATMYWLLTGHHVPTMIPKGGNAKVVDLRPREKIPTPREFNPNCAPALSTLVMHCIQENPADRPQSMKRVVDRLDIAINQMIRDLPAGDQLKAV